MKERVRAQQKIKMCFRSVELLLEMPHRFHRVIYFAAGMSRARLGQRCDEARMIRASERHHRVTVRVGRHAATMFVRRAARGNEMDFVEAKAALRGSRDRQMPDVDRIECSAEQRNPALVRGAPGSAVALRRGDAQRFSVRGAAASGADAWGSFLPGSGKSGASSTAPWGARRSSASAIARTSCGMPSPEAAEMAWNSRPRVAQKSRNFSRRARSVVASSFVPTTIIGLAASFSLDRK